jgi:hypothetical protein
MKPQISREFSRYLRLMSSTALAAAALSACGGGSDSPAQSPAATVTKGTISVAALNDAPSCGMSEINVSIARIRFHQDPNATMGASGWSELSFSPSKKVNLLTLASVLSGSTTDFGELSLPTGIYTQMRVVIETATTSNLAPNTFRLAGSTATPTTLETPSSLATEGVKIPLDLKIEDGKKANVVFDLDVCNAIQPRAAAYVLKPQARPVPATLNGISGFIDPAVLSSGVVITAQQSGMIAATTVPNPTTGEFLLPRLAAGKYDVVALGKGRTASVIGQVPVDAASIVPVSTSAAPISLTTSTTSKISGQITYTAGKAAPDSGTWVAASQSINAVATVGNPATVITYRFQPVDQATGNYTLTDLPRSSLRYALYKPALPLTLANIATTPVAGHYKVEGVASGYSRVSTFGLDSKGVPAVVTADVNVSTADNTTTNITFY